MTTRVATVADQSMSERQWQATVLRLASLYGWHLTYHTHDSRRSDPGFPDLVLVNMKAGRIVFLELKTEKGRVLPDQELWINGLRACGLEAHVVRPSDLDFVHNLLNTRRAA